MAFNINVKKKDSGAPGEKINLLEDIRVFVVLMAIACIGLIVLIVFGVKSNEEIKTEIAKEKKTYQENQLSIANLKALQARSSEFEAQRDMYNAMIPDTQDRQAVMIDMERRVEGARCTLTDLTFGGDAAIGGTPNTNTAAAHQHKRLEGITGLADRARLLCGHYGAVQRFGDRSGTDAH